MTPLDRVASLKLKLGLLIVVAIVMTLATMLVAGRLGYRPRYGALAALFVALAAVQLLARGVTAPLREMAGAARAMARGDHGRRVTVPSRDEVGQLAAAFNHMAAELEQLDRLRSTFVADAAHELRTPLASLRAGLENAVDGVEEPDLPALLAQTERLGRLADQLLDLSRLDSGAAAMQRESVDVCELMAEHDLIADVGDGLRVRGDPVRLRQVLTNVVLNTRHHAPGATIIARARASPPGRVRLEIEDDGPGLADADRQRVFDRFARADRARSVDGSGLGLAIVRSIVELHDGSVHAEQAQPHGLRIVIDLPAAR
jgi:signal transduction histidine kinase